jgi:uncharacterized protein (TIGR02996 family)
VTSEDDFQAALDANPTDWQTRLVLADWLQERGDPRAGGYRALGVQRVCPSRIQMEGTPDEKDGEWLFIFGNTANDSKKAIEKWGQSFLPTVWFKKVTGRNKEDRNPWWRYFNTRREADDTAALAFATLAKAHRAKLLTPPPVEVPEPAKTRKRKPAKPKTTARKRTKG